MGTMAASLASRLAGALLALALIAGGTVLVVEVVAAWLGAGWTILPTDTRARFATWTWDGRTVVTTIVVLWIVGIAALASALWRRRPVSVAVERIDGETPAEIDAAIERRNFERSVGRHLEMVDGVDTAKVRVRRNRVVATVETRRRINPGEVEAAARTALGKNRLVLAAGLPTDVRLHAVRSDT